MFTQIPSSILRQLVKLSERKEALMAQIQGIDREMVRLQGRHGVPSATAGKGSSVAAGGRTRTPSRRRAKRGALKAKILGALRSAGKKGLTIRELSSKLDVRNANLYVWFNGTGRKVSGLRKIGPAKYRLGR